MTDDDATGTSPRTPAPDALDSFATRVLSVPFGTLSKTETEFLVFRLLVETGKIDLDSSDFVLSNRIFMTPTRVRNLLYRYDQRVVESDPTQLSVLVDAANTVIEAATDTDHVRVLFRRAYLRDYVSTRLLERGVITEVTLTPGLVTVPIFDLFFILRGASEADTEAGGQEARDRFERLWSQFTKAHAKGKTAKATALRKTILADYLPKAVSTTSGVVTVFTKVTDEVTKLMAAGAGTP